IVLPTGTGRERARVVFLVADDQGAAGLVGVVAARAVDQLGTKEQQLTRVNSRFDRLLHGLVPLADPQPTGRILVARMLLHTSATGAVHDPKTTLVRPRIDQRQPDRHAAIALLALGTAVIGFVLVPVAYDRVVRLLLKHLARMNRQAGADEVLDEREN